MLFPALFALGGAFFFFVLRVQGADGSFPKPLTREIIRLRYGIGLAAPLPQREIAAQLGISRSYV